MGDTAPGGLKTFFELLKAQMNIDKYTGYLWYYSFISVSGKMSYKVS